MIHPNDLRDALCGDEVGRAVEVCIRLLSYGPRTERELLQRLARKDHDAEVAAEAVAQVRERGYVDDAEFARFWVSNRDQFKPMGARRLLAELHQKGVARETAQESVDEALPDGEYDAAMRAGRKKLRTLATEQDYAVFRRNLGGFLARQGFDWESSSRVVAALWAELHGEAVDDGDAPAG
ncbi:MAG: regulatory protein RecX [Chloroflexia bacterium]